MAVYKIFPTKDATLYSLYPEMNTGLDEIIEATTTTFSPFGDANPQVSRYLISFDQNEIENIINTKISGSWETRLRIFHANFSGLYTTSTLECYPISGSWYMGTGHYLDSPEVTNGTSWNWLNYKDSEQWATSSFSQYVTASYSGSTSSGGGTWYTGSNYPSLNIIQSQSFNYQDSFDLNLNVTDTIKVWYSSSNNLGNYINIINNGFIIKQPINKEFINSSDSETEFKFFSADTHNIYQPQLEFRWDDYKYNTGSSSFPIITDSNASISSPNNIGVFYNQSVQRFRLDVRPQYPIRVYQTASIYTNNYYLPPTISLYAIKDLDTNEYVIDFNNTYTKISADSQSNYFDIYMNGLQPERYYTILIQTTIDGSTLVIDQNIVFKVING